MLTRLQVRNFKGLPELDIEFGQTVVLIGPNNSGKTSALQALSLWQTGVREWLSRRRTTRAKERPGIAINRRALTHTPVPEAKLLWHGLKVNVSTRKNGIQDTQHIYVETVVDGQSAGLPWQCGLQFYYANPESIYCRPIEPSGAELPEQAAGVRVAFMPPMSGLLPEEPELQPGRIDVLIGEGQTAQVLRNLCLRVAETRPADWTGIKSCISRAFGTDLNDPVRDSIRGSILLTYRERGVELDIASNGRGLHQTLLLLAHVHANPGATLLLDEPDAHLEILRQREIYNLLTDFARAAGSQIIAASHSEVVLNEAVERDTVIAFVGRPHPIDARTSQVAKSLREIGWDQYFQAEIKGAVLYLEGSTDLAILRTLAERISHPAADALREPFAVYVANEPRKAEAHFYGLQEAKPDLRAFALFDRLDRGLPPSFRLPVRCWTRREIENYLATPAVLLRFARGRDGEDDLLVRALSEKQVQAMHTAIEQVERAFATLGRDPWSTDEKVSETTLPAVFRNYYQQLGLRNEMEKSDYNILASYTERAELDIEVIEVLDQIAAVLGGLPA